VEVFEYRYAAELYLDPWSEAPPGTPPPPNGLRGPRRILVLEGGAWRVAEVRGRRYYKLVPLRPRGPPTLEIDGIHMHRVSGTDPLSDAAAKVAAARVCRGCRVLDLCTGLGYTAIKALERGARLVHSVEVDENVLWLAERNPWSKGLGDPRVAIILGDALEVSRELPSNYYDRVIHDPPRFGRDTSHLYSIDLYREIYRVLKPGGVLYHYTGEPGRLRGLNLPGRVARFLREAGFEDIRWHENALGVAARKPRRASGMGTF
jgi:predicted methyltransferase